MTHRNTQKGLHSVKLIPPKIDVGEDSFIPFLKWLVDKRGFTTTGIINVVATPHSYEEEWEEYYETR